MEKAYTCKDDILAPLLKRTQTLLKEDLGINIKEKEIDIYCPDKLDLKDYTAMVGTGGTLSIIFSLSYENSVLDKLVEVFMDGEEVAEEEADEIKDSVASEVANTIIGNALPFFPNSGKGVTITPPITVIGAKAVSKYGDSKIATSIIETDFGEISVNAIGPRLLFIDKFNFKE